MTCIYRMLDMVPATMVGLVLDLSCHLLKTAPQHPANETIWHNLERRCTDKSCDLRAPALNLNRGSRAWHSNISLQCRVSSPSFLALASPVLGCAIFA